MGDAWKKLLAGLTARWNALGPGQKFVAGSLLAGAAATIIVMAALAKHVSYAVLYAGLDPEQASGVVEELREMKISFRLADAGRTIMVSESDVYAARLELAGRGLPGGGSAGYEIFDRRGFGMTNFMQQINYRRALEGELTRTVVEMDEVLGARVHLVVPERNLFMDDERRPSASVMLRLKPGVRLTRRQIEGISYLVAGSVEGLAPAEVNILDYYGNLLSGNQREDGLDVQATARLELKTSVEEWLEGKAQTLLDHVVGPGNSVVRVTAELDFERLERDVETYDTENTVVRSEEISEEVGGEAGGESRNSVTNYEINKTVERLVKAPGNLRRLTVAVTVDGHYGGGAGKKEGEREFVPRSDGELTELAAIVRNAVGLDEKRGDLFHIACVQFDHRHLAAEQEEMKRVERQMLWRTVGSKGLLVIGALVGFLVLRKIFRTVTRVLAEVAAAPSPARSAAGGPEPGAAAAAEVDALADRVSEMARRQPEESAALIRNMLAEGD